MKRGGGGGKVIQNKRRAKNDVAPRVYWTLNMDTSLLSLITCIKILIIFNLERRLNDLIGLSLDTPGNGLM